MALDNVVESPVAGTPQGGGRAGGELQGEMPGFRTEEVVLATTLLDEKAFLPPPIPLMYHSGAARYRYASVDSARARRIRLRVRATLP